jgi:hypothetical protein
MVVASLRTVASLVLCALLVPSVVSFVIFGRVALDSTTSFAQSGLVSLSSAIEAFDLNEIRGISGLLIVVGAVKDLSLFVAHAVETRLSIIAGLTQDVREMVVSQCVVLHKFVSLHPRDDTMLSIDSEYWAEAEVSLVGHVLVCWLLYILFSVLPRFRFVGHDELTLCDVLDIGFIPLNYVGFMCVFDRRMDDFLDSISNTELLWSRGSTVVYMVLAIVVILLLWDQVTTDINYECRIWRWRLHISRINRSSCSFLKIRLSDVILADLDNALYGNDRAQGDATKHDANGNGESSTKYNNAANADSAGGSAVNVGAEHSVAGSSQRQVEPVRRCVVSEAFVLSLHTSS